MHKALLARKIMTRDFLTKRKHVEENAFDSRYELAASRPRNDVVQICFIIVGHQSRREECYARW